MLLDETLTLLRFGVAPAARPDPVTVEPPGRALSWYLDTVQPEFVSGAAAPLPPTDVDLLRTVGIPTVDDDTYRPRWRTRNPGGASWPSCWSTTDGTRTHGPAGCRPSAPAPPGTPWPGPEVPSEQPGGEETTAMHRFLGLLNQPAPRRARTVAPGPAVADEVLSTLRAESDRIADKIHGLYMARESVIALVSTAAGGVLAVTETAARFAAIVALPYVILGLMAYALDRANEMKTLGGYQRALEGRINDLLGKPCLLWESRMAPDFRNTRRCQWPLRIFRVGAVVVSAGTALWAAFNPDAFSLELESGTVERPLIAAGVALYAVGVVAVLELYRQGEKVGDEAFKTAERPERPD